MDNIGRVEKIESTQSIIGNCGDVVLRKVLRFHSLLQRLQVILEVLHDDEEMLKLLALVIAHWHDDIQELWCVNIGFTHLHHSHDCYFSINLFAFVNTLKDI